MQAYEGDVDYPRLLVVDGEGVATYFEVGLELEKWFEFRADIDWSYVNGDGKYGLFSLFMRTSVGPWIPITEVCFQLS
jgi:hypothetical protein